jgi:hypothetical protein
MVRSDRAAGSITATPLERRLNGLVLALAIVLIHVSVILLTSAGVPEYPPMQGRHQAPPKPDQLSGTAPGPTGPAQYRHRGSLAAAAGRAAGLPKSQPWP